MSGISLQMIFSPQNCTLERLQATLTADRRMLATRILDKIENTFSQGGSCYNLLNGPRGSGKTHVLSYVCKTLQAKYTNVSGPKIICLSEEARGLTTLFDLLITILRAAGTPNEELTTRLSMANPVEATQTAVQLFEETTRGACVLIVIENANNIFDSLGEESLPTFRALLQEHARVSLLASTTSLFTDSSKPDHPFYGFFTIHPLAPLNAREAREYLQTLAHENGDQEIAMRLGDESIQPRINAIWHLTGGNHRLLAMLSSFLTVDGLLELVEPFVQMVDRELTPYYQQRLDRLSAQQCKIIQVIADHHGSAITVGEIARYSFSTSQVVSRQLTDLHSAGFVTRHQRGRESCYELTEPLLRLVLDIKQGRDRPLRTIVQLLKDWFGADELQKLGVLAPSPAREYYAAALFEHLRPDATGDVTQFDFNQESTGNTEVSGEPGISELHQGKKLLEQNKAFDAILHFDLALSSLKPRMQKTTLAPNVPLILSAIDALSSKGFAQMELGSSNDASKSFDEVIELGSVAGTVADGVVAIAMLAKGLSLRSANRHEDALIVYDEVLQRFASDKNSVAAALVGKGESLCLLDRSDEALTSFSEVIDIYRASEDHGILRLVATALLRKGIELESLGRFGDELETYDEIARRFAGSDDIAIQTVVAKAMVKRGVVLERTGQIKDALAQYDDVAQVYGAIERTQIREQVATALLYKAVAVGLCKRTNEELTIYNQIIDRYGHDEQIQLKRYVARALFNKGVTLGGVGRTEEELETYSYIVQEFETASEPDLRDTVAKALVNLGASLGNLGRWDESAAKCDEVIRRFGRATESTSQESVARALVNKGNLMAARGNFEEAVASYDDIVGRITNSGDTNLRIQLVKALTAKGYSLLSLNRAENAIDTFDKAIASLDSLGGVLSGGSESELDSNEFDLRMFEAERGRITGLFRILRYDDAFASMSRVLEDIRWSDEEGGALVEDAIGYAEHHVDLFSQLVRTCNNHRGALRVGLMRWVMGKLPTSAKEAEEVGHLESALSEAFKSIPDAEMPLRMLSASRRHVLGDAKALLELPVELRQLVQGRIRET